MTRESGRRGPRPPRRSSATAAKFGPLAKIITVLAIVGIGVPYFFLEEDSDLLVLEAPWKPGATFTFDVDDRNSTHWIARKLTLKCESADDQAIVLSATQGDSTLSRFQWPRADMPARVGDLLAGLVEKLEGVARELPIRFRFERTSRILTPLGAEEFKTSLRARIAPAIERFVSDYADENERPFVEQTAEIVRAKVRPERQLARLASYVELLLDLDGDRIPPKEGLERAAFIGQEGIVDRYSANLHAVVEVHDAERTEIRVVKKIDPAYRERAAADYHREFEKMMGARFKKQVRETVDIADLILYEFDAEDGLPRSIRQGSLAANRSTSRTDGIWRISMTRR